MVTSNLQRTVYGNEYCLFGSQATPRVSFFAPRPDWYGSKPGRRGKTQTYCTMKDSKPTAIVSTNSVAGTLSALEQETQIKNVRQAHYYETSNAGGPKDLLNDEDDDPIRDFIKDHLPRYKAPTDLKDKIRSITSFKREEI